MVDRYTPKERTSQALVNGFDVDPSLKTVEDGEVLIIYRAHGIASKIIGRFFFTPQIAGIPRLNWTADLLEKELNAAIWGNDFKYLAKFQARVGTNYKIGHISHDKYQGKEQLAEVHIPFDQYCYFRNENLFYQVEIKIDGDWRNYLNLLEDVPINAGRFSRKVGNC